MKMNELENANFINETMKRRLTYKGKRVYIKSLDTKKALVSYTKEGNYKQFKVNIKDLVDFK